jgi:hypothetical protein
MSHAMMKQVSDLLSIVVMFELNSIFFSGLMFLSQVANEFI